MEVTQHPSRSTAAPSSPALLEAVRRGDPRALERWYRTEHPRVWRTCLGLVADPAEADDLAQDAIPVHQQHCADVVVEAFLVAACQEYPLQNILS